MLSWMLCALAALVAAGGPLHSARAADPSESAVAANDQGITSAAAGDLDGALAAWERAAKLAREAGDPALQARALANAGRAFADRGDAPHAASLLGDALDLALALPATSEASETLVSIGRSFARLADAAPSEQSRATRLASAHRALAAALERAEASGDRRLASLAAGRLAEVYAASGRDDDALSLGRRALFAAQEIQALELIALWQRDLARSLLRRGERDAAIGALRQSVSATEAVRPQLTGAAAPLRDELRSATIELIDLLLRKASATSAELHVVGGRDMERGGHVEACAFGEADAGGVHQEEVGARVGRAQRAGDLGGVMAGDARDHAVGCARAVEGGRLAARHVEAQEGVEEIPSFAAAELFADQLRRRLARGVASGRHGDAGVARIEAPVQHDLRIRCRGYEQRRGEPDRVQHQLNASRQATLRVGPTASKTARSGRRILHPCDSTVEIIRIGSLQTGVDLPVCGASGHDPILNGASCEDAPGPAARDLDVTPV